jgi:hypothetical protein
VIAAMSYYVVRSNPELVAKDSHAFMEIEIGRIERELETARVELDVAEEHYNEIDTPTFKDEKALAVAQEHFDRLDSQHDTTVIKQAWEAADNWKKKISTSVAYTKKLLAAVDWVKIFRARPHNQTPPSNNI